MTIKLLFKALLVSCLFFVVSGLFASNASAARLLFDPTSNSQTIGTDIQIKVNVDTEGTQIFGADAAINYPSDGFTVKSVSYGNFFTDSVTPIQNSGQIIIRGSFFSSNTGMGSGTGTFATVTLTALKAAGTATLSFACPATNTDIIDANGNNILSCNSLNQSVVTFSTGATPTPTPAPDTTNQTNNPTNACGGTCGSAYNCNMNLFCYQGFCRNPDCPSSSTCGCPTATPTPAQTPKPIYSPKASATPAVITLVQSTPFPPTIPSFLATPSATASKSASLLSSIKPIYIYGILAAVAIVVILILASTLKKKSPPKINIPPTQTPPGPNIPL